MLSTTKYKLVAATSTKYTERFFSSSKKIQNGGPHPPPPLLKKPFCQMPLWKRTALGLSIDLPKKPGSKRERKRRVSINPFLKAILPRSLFLKSHLLFDRCFASQLLHPTVEAWLHITGFYLLAMASLRSHQTSPLRCRAPHGDGVVHNSCRRAYTRKII